jgi:predicted nucleic acid-binding protein
MQLLDTATGACLTASPVSATTTNAALAAAEAIFRGSARHAEARRLIEAVLGQRFIEASPVDEGIGVAARRLMRRHAACRKPSDAIHLATALRLSVDELHTFDGADLLNLDGQVMCADGRFLPICRVRPQPPAPAPLLDALENPEKT